MDGLGGTLIALLLEKDSFLNRSGGAAGGDRRAGDGSKTGAVETVAEGKVDVLTVVLDGLDEARRPEGLGVVQQTGSGNELVDVLLDGLFGLARDDMDADVPHKALDLTATCRPNRASEQGQLLADIGRQTRHVGLAE